MTDCNLKTENKPLAWCCFVLVLLLLLHFVLAFLASVLSQKASLDNTLVNFLYQCSTAVSIAVENSKD